MCILRLVSQCFHLFSALPIMGTVCCRELQVLVLSILSAVTDVQRDSILTCYNRASSSIYLYLSEITAVGDRDFWGSQQQMIDRCTASTL